jgi:hypothetical protein
MMASSCSILVRSICGFGRRAGTYPAAALRQHPLRPEPEKDHDQQPDGHPLQVIDQAGRPELGNVPGGLLEADRHQDRAEHGPAMVARAADDHGGEQHDGLRIAPRRRRPQVDEPDQDRGAQRGQRTAEHEHRSPQREQVLAQRVSHDVVVAHRPHWGGHDRRPNRSYSTRLGEHADWGLIAR